MKNKGVTLIELAVVLSVFAILAAVTMFTSGYFNSPSRVLNSTARTMQADFRMAQRYALIDGQTVYIFLEPDKYIIRNSLSVIKIVNLPEGITLSTNTQGYDYTPRGTLGRGGTITLMCDGLSLSLTVLPTTGRVRIGTMVSAPK